jgi:L-amino acid N-acyltransferase YncA
MADLKISRYDPRKDKEGLEELIAAYDYRSIYPIQKDLFSKEIGKRVLDLKLRNSMVLAKEDEKIVGAGSFTTYDDYLGNTHCIVHDVAVRKEDSYKKGIEEAVLRELFKYIKSTMKIEKIELFFKKGDSNAQSLLLKLGIKPSDLIFYEHSI